MSMNQYNEQTQSQLPNDNSGLQGSLCGVKADFFEKCVFIVTIIACLVCSTGSTIGGLAVVAAFALFILKPEYLLGPILFFSVFDDYLLMAEGASISRFLTLYFIVGVALLILKRKVIKRETLFLLLLIAFAVILSFYSVFGHSDLPVTFVLSVALTIAMVNFTVESKDKIIKQVYSYCVWAVVYVYYMLTLNGFDSLVDGTRMTIAAEINSNQLAMGLAVVMALLASNLMIVKKHKLLNILLMIATCVALFLTGSRTGLLAGVLASFLVFIVGTQEKGKRGKAVIFSLLGAVALYLVYFYMQENFPLLMERFTIENIEETGGTGRLDIWNAYIRDYFPKYWFAGIGFDAHNMYYAMLASNGEGHGAHNILIEIISKSGLLGLTLFGIYFFRYFRMAFKALRKNKCMLLSLAIVFATLINGIGENTLTVRFLWFGIGLGYVFLYGEANEVKASTKKLRQSERQMDAP